MKKKNNKILIYTITAILLIGIIYFGFISQTMLSTTNVGYIRISAPDRTYSCYDGGFKDGSGYRTLAKYSIPEEDYNKVKENKARLINVSLNNFLSRSNYGDKRLGIYAYSNDWDCKTVTFNNAPQIGEKLGFVFRPKYGTDGRTSTSIQTVSDDLYENLKEYIELSITNNQKEFSLRFAEELMPENNYGDTVPVISYDFEDSVKYYKLTSNICSESWLFPEQITSNDYLTLEECQSKISNLPEDIPDDTIEEPQPKGFILWLNLIINWFKELFN